MPFRFRHRLKILGFVRYGGLGTHFRDLETVIRIPKLRDAGFKLLRADSVLSWKHLGGVLALSHSSHVVRSARSYAFGASRLPLQDLLTFPKVLNLAVFSRIGCACVLTKFPPTHHLQASEPDLVHSLLLEILVLLPG